MKYLASLIILIILATSVFAEVLKFEAFRGINTYLHESKIQDNEASDCRDFLVDDGNLVRRPGFWKYSDASIDTLGGIIGMIWYNGEIFVARQGGIIAVGEDTSKFTVDMFPDEDLIHEWDEYNYNHSSLLWDSWGTVWRCDNVQYGIATDGDNKEDKFDLTMPSLTKLSTSDVIDSVQGRFLAKGGAGKVRMILTSGSTADTTGQFSVTSTATTFTYGWSTNPADDGAWARSDLVNLQIAVLCDSATSGCVMVDKFWVRIYADRSTALEDGLVFGYPVYFTPFEDNLIISTNWAFSIKYKNTKIDTLGDIIWGTFTEYAKPDSSAIYDSSRSFGIYDLNGAFLQDLDTGWVSPIVSNSAHWLSLLNDFPYNDSALSTYKIFCRPARTENLDTGTVTSATESTLVHTGAFTSGVYNNNTYYCEITSGVGLGQINHIWSNDANSLKFRNLWEVTPTSTSKYAIFQRVMPRAPMAYWQDCLFACGVYYKNRIYFSDPDDPEYFPLTQYLIAPGSRNDSILALGASQYLTDQSSDELKGVWVFQTHTISMIAGTSPNFSITTLADNISFIAPKSLVFIGDTPFYLGYDGVYAGIKKVSQKVKRFINRMNKGQAYLSAGGYYDGHYFLSIPDSLSDVPNLTLVYNPETEEWTTFNYGFTDYLSVLTDSLRFYMASISSPDIYRYGNTSDTGYVFIPYWTSKRFNFNPYTVYINRGFMTFDDDSGMVKVLVYEGETLSDSLTCLAEGLTDTVKYLGDKLINTSFQFKVTQDSNIDTLTIDNFGFFYNVRGIE